MEYKIGSNLWNSDGKSVLLQTFKLFTGYINWALILFSSLLTLDFFPMTYSKILIFLKLDHMPLNEDKLILQAATADEQCVLFKRANPNSIIYTATWICI